jgi:putative transcriptional regulator
MTQEELAKAVGVTRQTIHAVEKGKYFPSVLLAYKLAEFFGTTVTEVFYVIKDDENEKK